MPVSVEATPHPLSVEVEGEIRTYPPGVTPLQIYLSLKKEEKEEPIVAEWNGKLWDLSRPLPEGGKIVFHTAKTPSGLSVLRHSTAHLMAQAIKRLYPNARITIGPVIEDGFYYDIDCEKPFTPDDLKRIEEEMKKIQKENLFIKREEISKEEAYRLFEKLGETYKLEILNEIPEPTVSIYRQGEFVDLCRGPHVPRTGVLKVFKLLQVAGAYWRGDERNPMLQRIYGTAFPTEEELKEYLHFVELAKKRDHRRLGQELKLFSIHEEVGAGLILWHPKGVILREMVEKEIRTLLSENDYQFVLTPHVARENLWEISGHLKHYTESMFPPMDVDGIRYRVKPMNCPFHIQIYKSYLRSYKELPLRLAEFGTVYRYERGGVMHGLMRVRGFTQDDAHIFLPPELIEEEIVSLLKMIQKLMNLFQFEDLEVYLSTQEEKFVEDPELTEKATSALKNALDKVQIPYKINPGEGAFYGPKIDITLRDSLKRRWQCGTIQVDFILPRRFGLKFIDSSGKEEIPVMIHRALVGSLERFVGILIEHFGGAFPFFLAPTQVKVIPVSEAHHPYGKEILQMIKKLGYRGEGDFRPETLNKKIRDSQTAKIPLTLVVGEKEMREKTVSYRKYGEKEGKTIPLESLPFFLSDLTRTSKRES